MNTKTVSFAPFVFVIDSQLMRSILKYPIDRQCIKVNDDANKIVCVCDEKFCDKLSFTWPELPGQASLVETTRSGDRFKSSSISSEENVDQDSGLGTVRIQLDAKGQTILGWGGAFTDAATINIKDLKFELSEQLLLSYFGPDGLQYNFGRVPIAGSDFSTRPYSYDDSPAPDYNLTNWSLSREDLDYRIPVIQRARDIVISTGQSLKLFGSPWSPPKWMKTSKDFKRGYLIDDDRVYESYANYLIKFFDAFKAKGLGFWGSTVQNEPITAYLPSYYFNSLQLGNSQAIKFISKFLGPALEAHGYTKENFKLMVGDDSLGFINTQVPAIMKDPGVKKYVSGLAFHWYMSGTIAPYDFLNRAVKAIEKDIEFVMMSEACTGWMVGSKHVDIGNWSRGESYASDIIEDLRRKTGAWIDWNLALDMKGGPNWVENYVDSPILVDKNANKFYKQPMYYALAHFSRFFRPGSVYTDLKLEGGSRKFNGLMLVAAQNTDTGHVVLNVLNKSNSKKGFSVVLDGGNSKNYTLKAITVQPKSINTIILKV